MQTLDPTSIARQIGIPIESWPGNCYGIAHRIVEEKIIDGHAVYGHYLGPVAAGTLFHGKPIIQHGWVKSKHGPLYDPTRFVFEGTPAYISKIPSAQESEYDEGGNVFRLLAARAIPSHDLSLPQALVPLGAQKLFTGLLQRSTLVTSITFPEAMWLANLSTLQLKQHAKPLFNALIEMDYRSLIPIDNQRMLEWMT